MLVGIIVWGLIVVGGWLRLKSGRCTPGNWYWQLPTNLFIEADRSVRDVFRREDEPRETLSSWAERTGSKWLYAFNLLMVDPTHCRAYLGE